MTDAASPYLHKRESHSHDPSGAQPVGRHLLADLHGVDPGLLTGLHGVSDLLERALRQSGFSIVGSARHAFPGPGAGVTAIFLLSESHASIHTYPEREYAALDVFSCGNASPEAVLAVLEESLRPSSTKTEIRPRGILPQPPRKDR